MPRTCPIGSRRSAVDAESRRIRIAAVVFDMDGVIVDSGPVIEHAWGEVSRRHGRVLTPDDIARCVHGRPGSETVRLLFPDRSESDRKAIWSEVDRAEEEAECSAIPGVVGLLTALARRGVALGLVTSSWPRRIEFVLDHLELTGVFKVSVNRDDVPRGKPNPDPYLLASVRLGIDPERVLVFEDSEAGVRSAVAAGAVCVAVGDAGLVDIGAVASVPDFTGIVIGEAPAGRTTLTGWDAGIVVDLESGPARV
ncbi:HAD family hydrolase [Streptomyces sp. NPDC127098]|uniref:HAD family hydrolase n=1 Tax=Streptomyces sp. NPDC127098 TaxID=3347137 RepID=UPI00364CF1EE